jgi:hypothetical protein
MYDELVHTLRKQCADMDCGNCNTCVNRKAADAIEELHADKAALNGTVTNLLEQIKELGKPRWIPVTEEPPLKVGDDGYNGYLVYANGYYEVADYTTDKFDNVPYFHVNGEYEPDVTHYMPLPQPPKEE